MNIIQYYIINKQCPIIFVSNIRGQRSSSTAVACCVISLTSYPVIKILIELYYNNITAFGLIPVQLSLLVVVFALPPFSVFVSLGACSLRRSQ